MPESSCVLLRQETAPGPSVWSRGWSSAPRKRLDGSTGASPQSPRSGLWRPVEGSGPQGCIGEGGPRVSLMLGKGCRGGCGGSQSDWLGIVFSSVFSLTSTVFCDFCDSTEPLLNVGLP